MNDIVGDLKPRTKFGRPPNQSKLDNQNIAEESAEPTEANVLDAETERLEKRKRVRKPFGSHVQKLAYPERDGYHNHWFNDSPGRIQRAKEAGYENVKENGGEPVRRVVGVQEGGGPLYAFLMEIPKEWWEADLAEAQRRVDEMDKAIHEGKVAYENDRTRYIPTQGINIRRI